MARPHIGGGVEQVEKAIIHRTLFNVSADMASVIWLAKNQGNVMSLL